MQAKKFADYELSRLMLGTVQFGLPYGVANTRGQPEYREVLDILEIALEGGVNCFDTAAAYGNSEEVLGKALAELGVRDEVFVVTKVRALTEAEKKDRETGARAVERSVDESRERLGLDCLPLVLFHREADAQFLDTLASLKDRGRVRYMGVSCDNDPREADNFVEDELIDALQIPANMLDLRHRRRNIFERAAEQNKAVFVRSVFLQGLLVMAEEKIPDNLKDIIPVRKRLREIADGGGLTMAELAVRYILSLNGVTSVLTGVESREQMRENIRLVAQGPLPSDIVEHIEATVPDLPENLITPHLWNV